MNARTGIGDTSGSPQLIDSFGRRVTYLRLSITDRCNLRCRYCMPENGVKVLGHDEILSYEELERVSEIFISLGVNKIRITGGEPFVRKGCLEFMQRLKSNAPDLNLHLTTNGVAVFSYLAELKHLGIKGINLSLDTLDADRFQEITRRDRLDRVLSVFQETLRLGIPLKVNAVVQPETTDNDIVELAELIKDNAIALRFIEFMPFSGKDHIEIERKISLEERLNQLFPGLKEVSSNKVETARRFSLTDCQGTLGIIEGESRKFCSSCNKLRVTPNGMLKNCLYDEGVLDLRKLLRSTKDDVEVVSKIREAVRTKLKNGYEAARLHSNTCENSMASIGG